MAELLSCAPDALALAKVRALGTASDWDKGTLTVLSVIASGCVKATPPVLYMIADRSFISGTFVFFPSPSPSPSSSSGTVLASCHAP